MTESLPEEMETVHFVKTEDIQEKVEELFSSEKKKLSTLSPFAEIEHVGGTAIPHTVSKGDLDINMRVKSDDFNAVIEKLKTLYNINQPDKWTTSFASFKDDNRNLGIQVTVIGSPDDYFVSQRDYLRDHPEKVEELNVLKAKYEGRTMGEYREVKNKFFESLLK